MINFKMTIKENFASFKDPDNGLFVFIDSFDNHEFDVRMGTLTSSQRVGVVRADDDDTLNEELARIYQQSIKATHANNTSRNI